MADPTPQQQQQQQGNKGQQQQQQQKGGGNQAAKGTTSVISITPDDVLNRGTLANNFTLLAFGALGLLAIAHAAPWIHRVLFCSDPAKAGPPPVTVKGIGSFMHNANPGEKAGIVAHLVRTTDKDQLLAMVQESIAKSTEKK